MTNENTSADLANPSPEALAQTLEQGLAYYKLKKFGRALACFRELVKNLKTLDAGKQQVLAKALQSTTTGSLKKRKFKKAIKGAKLTLRVLNALARHSPVPETEFKLTQQKLLAALEGYLQFTVEQHQLFVLHELHRGSLPKGSVLQLCREGLNLLNKPLSQQDAPHNKMTLKNTPAKPVYIETLKELLAWTRQAAESAAQANNWLATLVYCKIATGPLQEALKPRLDQTTQEASLLTALAATQRDVETRLNKEAAQSLATGVASYLKTTNSEPGTDHDARLETARKYLREAVTQYNHLENQEKMLEAFQYLKKAEQEIPHFPKPV